MTRNESVADTMSSPSTLESARRRRAPWGDWDHGEHGRGDTRVLIRLPDLREPQQRGPWLKWLGMCLAMLGGSSLGAAGRAISHHSDRPRGTPPAHDNCDPDDLTDPANVARLWTLYKRFRPLIRYVVTHPKTIASGAIAAAAQFAALVAWHESTPPPPGSTAQTPPAVVDQAAPPWRPAQHYQADQRTNYRNRHGHHDCHDGATGPQLADPHAQSPSEAPHNGDGAAREARLFRGAAAEHGERLAPHAAASDGSDDSGRGDADPQNNGLNDAAPSGAHAAAPHVAMRPEHGGRPAMSRGPGEAWLRGTIIPTPTREASHEPAQSSIH